MELVHQAAAILAVFGGLAVLWFLRRRGWAAGLPRRSRELECLERLALGPQHSLHLVRAAGRLMLVSSSPAGCALLGDLTAADRIASPGEAR